MSFPGDSFEGSSGRKKRKDDDSDESSIQKKSKGASSELFSVQMKQNEPEKDDEFGNLSDELSDLYTSDSSFDSYDDEKSIPTKGRYDNSDDDYSDEKQDEICQEYDSAMGENIVWENGSASMEQFPFIKSECLLQPVLGDSPLDYFRHLFADNLLDEVVAQTNDYANKVLCCLESKKYSRVNAWKDTTKDELLVFVGLILHMGIIRINSIQDYWKTDALFDLRIFSDNMSRNRFLLLLRALHFAKIPGQDEKFPKDRLHKIRTIVNLFNARLSEIYYPGRELILDEPMILWRGRLMLSRLIPNKPHRYGIKLYKTTAPNGMILKFMVKTGFLDDSGGNSRGEKIAVNLLHELLDVGHCIFMDNYYSSYELAEYLSDRKTHCTGIIRRIGKTFPKEVKEKQLKRKETIARYANGVMIAKWKDKRCVIYISNAFKNEIVETTNKKGEVKSKPLPIVQYNKFMSDKCDDMLVCHPCERTNTSWATKIFVHILLSTMKNSHLIYNRYSDKNMKFHDFRLSVIKCLLKQPVNIRTPVFNNSEHLLRPREEKKGNKILRKKCLSCFNRGRRKDTIYVCTVCKGSPGYCLDCAKITHSEQHEIFNLL